MDQGEVLIPQPLEQLREAFGPQIELLAGGGVMETFVIKAEFRLGSYVYAALQSEAMKGEDEVELFRVIGELGEEPELETIEDDEEWELASEAYDDLLFAGDERP
ncbi:DUF1292 domain-containing protein [Paenibacillus algorifonticola]|uniref:DUF1292 domain-containing protein n=1 Tax=Paenibacillus algorifonticola TaxID=684063 RepID=UPI003D2D6143